MLESFLSSFTAPTLLTMEIRTLLYTSTFPNAFVEFLERSRSPLKILSLWGRNSLEAQRRFLSAIPFIEDLTLDCWELRPSPSDSLAFHSNSGLPNVCLCLKTLTLYSRGNASAPVGTIADMILSRWVQPRCLLKLHCLNLTVKEKEILKTKLRTCIQEGLQFC